MAKKSIVKLLEEKFPGGKWIYNSGLKCWLNREHAIDVKASPDGVSFIVSKPGAPSYSIELDQGGTRIK